MKNEGANNKIALITGCSSGIGYDLADRLTKAGYTVVATARQIESLEKLNAAMKLTLDVTDELSINSALAETMKAYGRLDILVNNAGYGIGGSVEELPEKELRSMFEVNFFGAVKLMRAVSPLMRERKTGTIVNISSIAGKLPTVGGGGYCASKFALEGLSDAFRQELKPFGVRVILIEPGLIGTRFQWTMDRLSEEITGRPLSPYRSMYDQNHSMVTQARKTEAKPGAVSAVVLKAVSAKNPKARYLVAVPLALKLLMRLGDGKRDRILEAVTGKR